VQFLDRRSTPILLAVAAGFALGQFLLFDESRYYEWDEAVYVSQASPGQNPLYFAATRARGITLLVAPVTILTESVTAIRIYLVIVSACALFLSFRVWMRVRPAVAPIGAALFGSTWIALFYGSEISPNLYSALGGVALAGFFVRALTTPESRRLEAGIVVAAIVTGLFRPYDLGVIALGLALGGIVTMRALGPGSSDRTWRSRVSIARGEIRTQAILAFAVVLGCVPWVVEQSIRWGGPLEALARAVRESNSVGLSGWGFHIPAHLAAANGPIFTYDTAAAISRGGALWWATWAILAAIGIGLAASRARRAVVVPLSGGLVAAVGYFFLTPIAPRFLSPAYALIALAAASGLYELLSRLATGSRGVLTTLAVASIILGLLSAWHVRTGTTLESDQAARRNDARELGQVLISRTGGADCGVWAQFGYPQVALASGCRGGSLDVNWTQPPEPLVKLAESTDHVYFLALSPPGPDSFLHGLPKTRVPVSRGGTWTLYVFTESTTP
jgi:hypothetical protein